MTEKQQALYDYIVRSWKLKQRPPTQRECSEAMGVSRTTIRERLMALERKGLILRSYGTTRGIFICER